MSSGARSGQRMDWPGGAAGAPLVCPRCGLRLKLRITFWECPGCGYKEQVARQPAAESEPAVSKPSLLGKVKDLAASRQPQAPQRLREFTTFELPRETNTERTALKVVIIAHLVYLFILFKAISWFPHTAEGLMITRYIGWVITLPSLLHLINLHLAVRPLKQIGVVWGIASAAVAGVLLLNVQGFVLPFFVYIEQYCQGSECPLWAAYGLILYQLITGVWTARHFSSEARLLAGA